MLYLTCTMLSSVDLAHYGVSRATDWVSVDCGAILSNFRNLAQADQSHVLTNINYYI